VRNVVLRKKKFTSEDYIIIGDWVDTQLKSHDVWLVLMPATQLETPMFKGLEHNQNWRLVFYNNKQKILVDITTERGRKLFDGIFDNTTVYPTEFTKNLILAHNLMRYGQGDEATMMAFEHAKKAFELLPSQASALELIMVGSRLPSLKDEITAVLQEYFDDFVANQSHYAVQHGYHHQNVACMLVCDYLRNINISIGNREQAEFYISKKQELIDELRILRDRKRW
jgi:hypothetical protein